MPDALFVTGSISAGVLCSAGVMAIGPDGSGFRMPRLVAEASVPIDRWLRSGHLRPWLASSLERAGWRESSGRVAALTLGLALSLAIVGWAVSPVLSPAGFAIGCGAVFASVNSSINRRRRRLAGELVPLLELFTLELSAGGSALAALGSVTVQVEGELAADLRRMLVASQMPGSATFGRECPPSPAWRRCSRPVASTAREPVRESEPWRPTCAGLRGES
jgi:hypothetical protein